MVATMKDGFFEKCRGYFENGDLTNTIDCFEKSIALINKDDDPQPYYDFLMRLLEHCQENQLKDEEALVLRTLGRTHSIFSDYIKSLNFHRESLKIQRKIGRKLDIANGLVFMAEDLEITEKFEDCIDAYQGAQDMFKEIGKIRKAKELEKKITQLKKITKELEKDEFYLRKFHLA